MNTERELNERTKQRGEMGRGKMTSLGKRMRKIKDGKRIKFFNWKY